MVDVFEPIARVMTNLQGLSVPVWKTEKWSRELIEWLRNAAEQCFPNGNFDFFPLMMEHGPVGAKK